LTLSEIGKELKISYETVRSIQKRTLEKVKEQVKQKLKTQ